MKEALVGLPGVTLVEDVWDEDLLHVTYDPKQLTPERMLEKIKAEDFEAEVKSP